MYRTRFFVVWLYLGIWSYDVLNS